MTASRTTKAPYEVGYGKPPLHTRFQKGRSGNPSGGRRFVRRPSERLHALALFEAYRGTTVMDNGVAHPTTIIQTILRNQLELAAAGNIRAQRYVLDMIRDIERNDCDNEVSRDEYYTNMEDVERDEAEAEEAEAEEAAYDESLTGTDNGGNGDDVAANNDEEAAGGSAGEEAPAQQPENANHSAGRERAAPAAVSVAVTAQERRPAARGRAGRHDGATRSGRDAAAPGNARMKSDSSRAKTKKFPASFPARRESGTGWSRGNGTAPVADLRGAGGGRRRSGQRANET